MTPIQILLCLIILLSFYNYNRIEKYENVIEYTSSSENIEEQNINTDKLCDYIGGILYINLDKRTDRRKTIEAELDTLKCPYQRLSATYVPKNGAKGCAKSHIDAITLAKKNKWKNVLIIEDDFVFKHNVNYKGILYKILQKLNNNFDVLMLSGHLHSYYKTNIDESLFKVNKCVKTDAYIVSEKFYDTLLNNFTESYNNQPSDKPNDAIEIHGWDIWAIDQHWKKLQPTNDWYIIFPTIGQQQYGFSDIEKKIVNYK